jgi:hypothetical protein
MTNATLRILELASIKERRIKQVSSSLKSSEMSLYLKIDSLKNIGFRLANSGAEGEFYCSKKYVLAPIVMK